MSTEELAAQIEAALIAEDLARVAPLLADDVRWGDSDEDFESTCHTRADVLAWYRRILASGVKARHIETLVEPDAVVIGWDLTWPPSDEDEDEEEEEEEEERPPMRYQVFRVAGGRIADIRGFPDKEEALAFSARR